MFYERNHFGGGGSIIVYAVIAYAYRSPLVVTDDSLISQRYRDDILAHPAFPLIHNSADISFFFQYFNVTSQTARYT